MSDFVLAQLAVLGVQFVGIPLLLLSVVIDECLSLVQSRGWTRGGVHDFQQAN